MFNKLIIFVLLQYAVGEVTEPVGQTTEQVGQASEPVQITEPSIISPATAVVDNCRTSVEDFYRCLDDANYMNEGLIILTLVERNVLQDKIVTCFRTAGCTGDPYLPVSEFETRNRCFLEAKDKLKNILAECVSKATLVLTLPFETFHVEENNWYVEFIYDRSSLSDVCSSSFDKSNLEQCIIAQIKNMTEYIKNPHFLHCDAQLICPISPECYKIWETVNDKLLKCTRSITDEGIHLKFLDEYKACVTKDYVEPKENEPYVKYFTNVFPLNAVNKQICAKNF